MVHAPVAQGTEQPPSKRLAGGSNPLWSILPRVSNIQLDMKALVGLAKRVLEATPYNTRITSGVSRNNTKNIACANRQCSSQSWRFESIYSGRLMERLRGYELRGGGSIPSRSMTDLRQVEA